MSRRDRCEKRWRTSEGISAVRDEQKRRNGCLYAGLLLGQSVCAFLLFWLVFPIFYHLLTHLGERQDLRILDQVLIVCSSVLLHCFYWFRLNFVAIVPPGHNVFLAHLVAFSSRISFFFGGALFSAVFFRHLPELEVLPPLGQTVVKAIYVAAVLFGLFCYSMELDRLARSIEEKQSA